MLSALIENSSAQVGVAASAYISEEFIRGWYSNVTTNRYAQIDIQGCYKENEQIDLLLTSAMQAWNTNKDKYWYEFFIKESKKHWLDALTNCGEEIVSKVEA